jgi:hypothetical protein
MGLSKITVSVYRRLLALHPQYVPDNKKTVGGQEIIVIFVAGPGGGDIVITPKFEQLKLKGEQQLEEYAETQLRHRHYKNDLSVEYTVLNVRHAVTAEEEAAFAVEDENRGNKKRRPDTDAAAVGP